jgi:hypothetical protein
VRLAAEADRAQTANDALEGGGPVLFGRQEEADAMPSRHRELLRESKRREVAGLAAAVRFPAVGKTERGDANASAEHFFFTVSNARFFAGTVGDTPTR